MNWTGYDGLLLDHDGVLVELVDRDHITAGLREHGEPRLAELGIDLDPALLDAFQVGAKPGEIRALADRYGVDPGALWRCRDDAIETALHTATQDGEKPPYDDVDALTALDVPCGVVSNNQRRIVEFVLETHGLRGLFDTVHARDPTLASLEQKKPAPTYLEAAMAGLDIEHPLYVGDSESDVVAAHRANVDVAFLRRPHNTDTSLSTDPTHEVSGLDEIVAAAQPGRY
jgi:haloacid dehalogenase superfamily, subfamily IA, variant 1 with third motif having Dx(3-4)D or Dx(3-4)E